MKWLLAISLLFLTICLSGQSLPNRYIDSIFTEITETEEVLFSTDVPQPKPGGGFWEWISGYPLNVKEYDNDTINLYMDIFEPTGDTLSARPLAIICFGGGFLAGSKDHWSIRLLAQGLAHRGFVTATIDYRLGMNIFDSDLATRAVYRAVQDSRAVIRYFKADAAGVDSFRVDTNNVFIGGHSAGAFIALHNLYLETEEERPVSTYEWTQDGMEVPDLGCLDCAGDNQEYSGEAMGAFSLAGALGFTTYINASEDGKPTLFHSEDDPTVPYDAGEPFSDLLSFVPGSDLPPVYGSLPISLRCDTLDIPHDFNSYEDRGHGVHEDGETALYDDILPGICDFLHREYLRPYSNGLVGDSVICSSDLIQPYLIDSTTGVYFDWTVEGGTPVEQSNISPSIIIAWDSTASDRMVSVVPYAANGARGDTIALSIDVSDGGTNSWVGGSGSWTHTENWSSGHPPLPCEDAVIDNNSTLIVIEIEEGSQFAVRSLETSGNVHLHLASGSGLRLANDQ